MVDVIMVGHLGEVAIAADNINATMDELGSVVFIGLSTPVQ